jgi:hypothetical protein
MQVNEAMSNDVKIAGPDQPIRDAARLMKEIDCGCLIAAVCRWDRTIGWSA